jgi:hypothetical protein
MLQLSMKRLKEQQSTETEPGVALSIERHSFAFI